MKKMLLASFGTHEQADTVLAELNNMGITTKDMSVVIKDGEHPVAKNTAQGATTGAATGGVIGGIAGVLAGVGVFPALAGFLIGGPLGSFLGLTGAAAMTAAGAASGATAGGIVGALSNLGFSSADAGIYNSTLDKGGVLFGVNVDESNSDKVTAVLEKGQAELVRVVDVKE